MKIKVFISDLCSGCEEIKKRLLGKPDIELIELSQEAIAEIIEATNQNVELPAITVNDELCEFKITNDGKLIAECKEKALRLD